jgi:hypothetical protein
MATDYRPRRCGEGVYLFITARHTIELEKVAKEIGKYITGIPADVSKPSDLDRLFARTTPATSRESSCSWTEDSRKSESAHSSCDR